MITLVFLAGLQYITLAFPNMMEGGEDPQWITQKRGYLLSKYRGDTVRVHCTAAVAGFNTSEVKVVWELSLRLLSDSGCNPKDPVISLAELSHVDSSSDADQFYQTVVGPPGWKLHAGGAALNREKSNVHSAWVGLTIDHVMKEHSGVYRCDALVGVKNSSQPKISKSSFTVLTVTEKDETFPNFPHMTIEESISALDYDSSVIETPENHKRVGESVNVSCAPRLLYNVQTFPFRVSVLQINFRPFHWGGSELLPVATYLTDSNQFLVDPPTGRQWNFSYQGTDGKHDRNLDSLHLRIDIKIPRVVVEDTGIFVCAVTKASTGITYHGVAGLKVSRNPDFLSGYCDPSDTIYRDLIPLEKAASLESLKSEALTADWVPTVTSSNESTACIVTIVVISLLMLLFTWLAGRQICKLLGCRGDEPKTSNPPESPQSLNGSASQPSQPSEPSETSETSEPAPQPPPPPPGFP